MAVARHDAIAALSAKGAEAAALHRGQASGTDAAARFHYRRLTIAELPALNQLYNAYYRKSRPLEEAEWLYGNNPNGSAVIYAAFDESGQLAGMRPLIPFKLWWRGEQRMAYEFADALVDPRHQGRGIFSRLVAVTCAWAEQEGHTVFSMPNESSLAVYRRNPALQVLGESYTLAKPLSWVAYVRHQLNRPLGTARGASPDVPAPSSISDGDVCLRSIDRFESDFAHIQDELRRKRLSFTLRTRETLQWRYFGSPVRNYRVALIEQRQGVRGYLVIRTISGIAHIVDLFLYPDADLARRSFRLAAKWAKGMGAIGIHFCGVGNSFLRTPARRSGYWFGKRSRPFVVDCASNRPLGQSREPSLSLEDVYFVMGDFDFL